MKTTTFLLLLFLIIGGQASAQIAINSDGSLPDNSAGLDVNFNNKGLLPPRMTFDQRNAISNPAEGLTIFCTNCNADGTGGVSVFEGGSWKMINLICASPNAPTAGSHVPNTTQVIWNWNAVPIGTYYKWNTVDNPVTAIETGASTTMTENGLLCWTTYTRYVWANNGCGQSPVSILTQTTSSVPFSPAPTAGTNIPSSDQIVWNWNIVAGATGYKWNSTNNFSTAMDIGTSTTKTETGLACNEPFTRYVWAYNTCGYSPVRILTQTTSITPSPPTAGTHIASITQVVWNWNAVAGALGYKWNTTNNYATATQMLTSTTKTETGLACSITYTRYVWAYNTCGNSTAVTLSKSTPICCGGTFTINHVAGTTAPVTKTVSYGTITNIPGEPSKCWITRNLGASQQSTAVSDATEASAGWYWQFNLKQGYKHDGTTRTPNTTWIYPISENSNWLAANDPCTLELGAGWRIPTRDEWRNVENLGGWLTWDDAWLSGLKLHAAGAFYYSNGSIVARGEAGYYWGNSQRDVEHGYIMYFRAGSMGPADNQKAGVGTIRCIRDF